MCNFSTALRRARVRRFDLKQHEKAKSTSTKGQRKMQKSTPLDHLRRDDEPQDGAAQQMMDSVVHDLEGGGGGGAPMPGYGGGDYPPEMDPRMQQGPPPGQGGYEGAQFRGGPPPGSAGGCA